MAFQLKRRSTRCSPPCSLLWTWMPFMSIDITKYPHHHALCLTCLSRIRATCVQSERSPPFPYSAKDVKDNSTNALVKVVIMVVGYRQIRILKQILRVASSMCWASSHQCNQWMINRAVTTRISAHADHHPPITIEWAPHSDLSHILYRIYFLEFLKKKWVECVI